MNQTVAHAFLVVELDAPSDLKGGETLPVEVDHEVMTAIVVRPTSERCLLVSAVVRMNDLLTVFLCSLLLLPAGEWSQKGSTLYGSRFQARHLHTEHKQLQSQYIKLQLQ